MMSPLYITSPSNPKFIYLKKIFQNASFRNTDSCFILDHAPSVETLSSHNASAIKALLIREGTLVSSGYLGEIWSFTDILWEKLTPTKTPQSMMALLCKPPVPSLTDLFSSSGLIVALDRVQDPGNAGAIVRNAVAFGAKAVLFLSGSASPYHPQTLRAMAGHCLSIPLLSLDFKMVLSFLSEWHLAGLDASASCSIQAAFSHPKTLLILGSEGNGFTQEFPNIHHYRIPTLDKVDSLNVAVASGIALFIHHTHNG